METIINQYITVGACYGIMAIGYIAWLSSGVINTKYIKKKEWSWAIFWEDLIKLFSHIGSIAAFVLGVNLLNWILARFNINADTLANVFSVGGVAIMALKSSANYYAKAYQNYQTFHSKRWTEDIDLDAGDIDWNGVAEDVKTFCKEMADALTPEHIQTDTQTEVKAEPTTDELEALAMAQEVLEGQGAEVNPLSRILPDGDNDGGKGWQCSKYSWYLATGVRMNYAPHPDYGPVNGNKMVDYLIQQLGWVECKKQDGAIFSYDTGQYGHTGIVKDAKNNIINDANWTPLKTGTHYLNLDAVGARYACPKSQVAQNTNSTANLAPEASTSELAGKSEASATTNPTEAQNTTTFKVGDVVKPLRKIDYDGRHLRQYDESYTITQINGDRAVLSARGQVWAAMRVGDIEKVE